MPPALSPAGRLRSRTSDISDLLRGRHDAKTSTDSQAPPPIPTHLAEPAATPSKPKSKFSFLGRMRKPSAVSPASARVANDAAASKRDQQTQQQRQSHQGGEDASTTVPSPSSAPSVDASQALASGADFSASSQKPSASSSASSPSNQRIPSGIPTATLRNLRTQNSTSFEHTSRPSNDSQGTRGRKQSSSSSASRPIITISPPHQNLQHGNAAHGADAFHAPRSAPRPPGESGHGSQSSSRQSSQSGIPTPTPTSSSLSERTALDSPAGTDTPSPATSVHSTTQFPIPTVDGPVATTSYKEESLLRKDHFEVGVSSESAQTARRVTVSGSSQLSGKQGTSSVGRNFAQDRQQRRQISVLQYGTTRGKQDASAGAIPGPSRVRRSGGAYSDSTSGNESTTSSHGTLSLMSRRRSAVMSSPSSGGVAANSGGKKAPPPLMRTWHTPPSTGPPPTDPLPAPPTNAALQPLILSTPSRGNIAPRPSSPVGSNKSLPPVPAKDRDGSVRGQGAKTPDLLSTAPSSPIRSEHEVSAAGPSSAATLLSTSSPLPSPTSPTRPSLASAPASASSTPAGTTPTRTTVREDAVKKLLADENATTDELREALRTQNAKYARLMSYLLSLTERHGMEKHEFLRRIETLEQDARRRERELKGLRWLVANSSQSLGEKLAAASGRNGSRQDPEQGTKGKERLLQDELTRADSGTLPRGEVRTRMRSCSESVASPSMAASISSFTRPILGPGSGDSAGRRSVESPTGSTEEGLFELQTTIAEFIAPTAPSPPTSVKESQQQRQKGQASTSSSSSSTSSSRAVVGGRQGSLSPTSQLRRSNTLPDSPEHLPVLSLKLKQKQKQARRTSSPVLPLSNTSSPSTKAASGATAGRPGSIGKAKAGLGIGIDLSASSSVSSRLSVGSRASDRDPHARSDSSTLSSIPSLTTLHTSSSGLSSIPETPRTDAFPSPPLRSGNSSDTSPSAAAAARRKKLEEERTARAFRRQSTSSLTSSTSSGSGSASYATSSRVSASPSIGQVLDRSSRQPEMDAILRKLRAFGNHGSP